MENIKVKEHYIMIMDRLNVKVFLWKDNWMVLVIYILHKGTYKWKVILWMINYKVWIYYWIISLGKCISYYDNPDQQVHFEGYYIEGKREGYGKEYDNSGNCIYEGYYFHDKEWNASLLVYSSPLHSSTLQNTIGNTIFGRKKVEVSMNNQAIEELSILLRNRKTPPIIITFILHSIPLY